MGIALVVEEIGKGSKLVFKYPLEPQKSKKNKYLPSTSSVAPSSSPSVADAVTSNTYTNAKEAGYLNSNSRNCTRNQPTERRVAATNTVTNSITGTGTTRRHHHQKHDSNNNGEDDDNDDDDIKDDIFFRLKARVMAKLFRTKPPLCGQPVSLNIEGTIFCCRSVLLNPNQPQQQQPQQHHHHQGTNNNMHTMNDNLVDDMSINSRMQYSASSGGAGISPMAGSSNSTFVGLHAGAGGGGGNAGDPSADGLVLFSIIVAMRPNYNHQRNIIWASDNFLDLDLYPKKRKERKPSNSKNDVRNTKSNGSGTQNNQLSKVKNNASNSVGSNSNNKNDPDIDNVNNEYIENRVNERGSLHFPAIRRIHLTLSRLCQVLEREERRCMYVSRQVSHLLKVGKKGEGEGEGETASTALSASPSAKVESKTTIADSTDNAVGETIMSLTSIGNENIQNNNSNTVFVDNSGGNEINTYDNPIANALDIYSASVEKSNNDNFASGDEEQRKIYKQKQRERLDLMLSAPPPPTSIKNSSNHNIKNSEENTDPIFDHEGKFQHLTKESIPIYGNLALELAQTYHALSRNSRDIRPSTDSLLSGRDGIVYINLHVAVQVEPAAAENVTRCDVTHSSSHAHHHINIPPLSPLFPFLRPYHTLLFYPLSAAEILRHSMKKTSRRTDADSTNHQQTSDHCPNLRRMEKLLLVADDPFKSLNDMATDAALSLPTIIETAKSLLESGLCIAVPVMTMSTKFACSPDVKLTASLRLEFAQHFDIHVPIFMVISVLTSPLCVDTAKSRNKSKQQEKESIFINNKELEPKEKNTNNKEECSKPERGKKSLITIGEVIEYLKLVARSYQSKVESSPINSSDGNNSSDHNLEHVPSVFRTLTRLILKTSRTSRAPAFVNLYEISCNDSQLVENVLKSMVTWLRSRCIIIEQKEYLTSSPDLHHDPTTAATATATATATGAELQVHAHAHADDSNSLFFEDFISEKYQSGGNVSTVALAWKYGISLRMVEAFRDWGIREKKISSITRIPSERDDWGAP